MSDHNDGFRAEAVNLGPMGVTESKLGGEPWPINGLLELGLLCHDWGQVGAEEEQHNRTDWRS